MADITMCKDLACPLAETCYRMKAEPNKHWQSYFLNSPRKEDKCEHYQPIEEDKIMSKRLEDLHPLVAAKTRDLIALCYDSKIPAMIVFTTRTNEEQAELYAQGRTKPGPPCIHNGTTYQIGSCSRHPLGLTVTKAKAGESYHNYGLAVDIVPIRNGKPAWIETIDLDNDGIPDFLEIGELGESIGFAWGGRWTKFRDLPHFQMTFGLTIQDLLAGKKITPEGKIV